MIDFHCHLDLYPNPVEVARECQRRGLYVLSVTTTPSAWSGTAALATTDSKIRTALGLHPQIAHERHGELSLFDELISQTPYVGEVGLDGGPEYKAHWPVQVMVFEHVLRTCANAGGRILSIHSRHASKEVLGHIEKNAKAGTPVLHWFTGTKKDLEKANTLGCWFSVGPAMLRSERGRAIAMGIPRDRLLTESDGPFAQLDGSPAYPWQVAEAIERLADLWEVAETEVIGTVNHNLRRLVTGG